MERSFLIFVFFMLVALPIQAETIVLKSGKSIEGEIIAENEKYIRLDFKGVPLTYYKDEIESVSGRTTLESVQPVFESTKAVGDSSSFKADKINKEFFDKMIQARLKAKRMKVDSITYQDMSPLIFMKNEGMFETDVDNHIAYGYSKLVDFKFKMGDMLKSALDKEVQKARQKGASEDQINQMQQKAQEFIGPLFEQMVQPMLDKMLNMKYEFYFTSDSLYYGLNGKWLKLNKPEVAANIWRGMESGDVKAMTEGIMGGVEGLSPDSQSGFSSMQDFFDKDFNDIVGDITLDEFNGQPCYRINYKIEDIMNIVKGMAEGQMKAKGDFIIEEGYSRELVSRENLLPLSMEMGVKASLSGPELPDKLVLDFKIRSVTTVPPGHLSIGPEALAAKEVQSEDEIKQLFFEATGMGDLLGTFPGMDQQIQQQPPIDESGAKEYGI